MFRVFDWVGFFFRYRFFFISFASKSFIVRNRGLGFGAVILLRDLFCVKRCFFRCGSSVFFCSYCVFCKKIFGLFFIGVLFLFFRWFRFRFGVFSFIFFCRLLFRFVFLMFFCGRFEGGFYGVLRVGFLYRGLFRILWWGVLLVLVFLGWLVSRFVVLFWIVFV